MISLFDVIYHLCILFKEASLEFARKVGPKLIEALGMVKEEDLIFPLLGTVFLSAKYY